MNDYDKTKEQLLEELTEMRQRMAVLEKAERSYRVLAETASDAILTIDEEGKIISANAAIEKAFGYTPDEIIEQHITILMPERMQNAHQSAFKLYMKTGKRSFNWKVVEFPGIHKSGNEIPLDISFGEFTINGKHFFSAIIRDVTERKHAEKAIQRSEQLKIAGELAVGLAHEIKNPLAGIKALAEFLADELSTNEENRALFSMTIEEIRRIEILIKKLLNFAKPPKPHLMDVNVNSILDKTINITSRLPALIQKAASEINVLKDFDRGIPEIMADPIQLKQVFLNLLLNAIDAMPDGGTLAVRTSYDKTIHSILIDISDTGKGIHKSMIDKIFQPFFTTKSKGTGLGLAISKQLIQQHGGDIRFANNPGGGTIFNISLPTKQSKIEYEKKVKNYIS